MPETLKTWGKKKNPKPRVFRIRTPTWKAPRRLWERRFAPGAPPPKAKQGTSPTRRSKTLAGVFLASPERHFATARRGSGSPRGPPPASPNAVHLQPGSVRSLSGGAGRSNPPPKAGVPLAGHGGESKAVRFRPRRFPLKNGRALSRQARERRVLPSRASANGQEGLGSSAPPSVGSLH